MLLLLLALLFAAAAPPSRGVFGELSAEDCRICKLAEMGDITPWCKLPEADSESRLSEPSPAAVPDAARGELSDTTRMGLSGMACRPPAAPGRSDERRED